jgi:hypothetical protein
MIIGANKRGNGGQLVSYLLNTAKNEHATLMEARGFADTHHLKSALNSIELEAAQTQGEKPFYHCWLRLDEGETLTAAQWQQSFEAVEHRLHLQNQARVIVEHQFQGEKHYHVVWSLVDRERGQMIELPFDGMRRTEVARKLEQEFGLRKLAPAHEPEQERLHREEWQAAARQQRTAAKVRDVKATIRDAWERSDTGIAFNAALQEHHLMLAIGNSERQPFGVVDAKGQFYVLTRTLDARAREVRGKLADLDRANLPTVEQAKTLLQARQAECQREATHTQTSSHANDLTPPTHDKTSNKQPEGGREKKGAEHSTGIGDRAAPAHTPEPEQAQAAQPPAGRFQVMDKASGKTSGVSQFAAHLLDGIARPMESLIEGVAEGFASLFDAPSPARPTPLAPLQKLQERAARERALNNMSRSVKCGDELNAADLRVLPPVELERLRDNGDEYLMRLVQRHDRERAERDWGRERER